MASSQAKLSEEVWLRLRREYEAPGANLSDLSRRYGVARPTIRERAKREGWVKGRAVEILPPALAQGAPGSPPPDGGEAEEPTTGLTDKVRAEILLRHQRDWHPVRRLIREATRGISRDGTVDSDKLADALALSKVVILLQKGERDGFMILPDFKPPVNAQANGQAISDWAKRLVDSLTDYKLRNDELQQRLAKYEPVEG